MRLWVILLGLQLQLQLRRQGDGDNAAAQPSRSTYDPGIFFSLSPGDSSLSVRHFGQTPMTGALTMYSCPSASRRCILPLSSCLPSRRPQLQRHSSSFSKSRRRTMSR